MLKPTVTFRSPIVSLVMAVCCSLLLDVGAARSETPGVPSLADLSAHAEFTQAQISPNGRYLAVDTVHEGKRALAVLTLEDMKPISVTGFYDGSEVGAFEWVNDERLVLSIVRKRPGRTAPGRLGEIYAVNADGSAPKYLYGINADERVFAGGVVLDTLDERHVVIQSYPFSMRSGKEGIPEALKVNVYSGRISRLARSNLRGAVFVTDHDAQPRLVYGVDDDANQVISYKLTGSRDWASLDSPFGDEILVHGFLPDSDTILLSGAREGDSGIWGLYQFDLKTGKAEKVYSASDTDVERVYLDQDGQPYGVGINRHYREFVPLKLDHPLTSIKAALQSKFPNHNVSLVSKTLDNQMFVVGLSAPSDPPSFYLFDLGSGALRPLMDVVPRVEGKLLATTDGITLTTRDGLTVHGYLTTPPIGAAPYPMVVMPHGGPHARDEWTYDPYVQMLATRGYAVLQVNFRGSTGYGDEFRSAGYGEWGRNVQHDIIDATRWAIADGVADPERIGIFGASFGGYSAFQAPLVEPGLFKAAVGYVGVYDLELLYNSGDIATTRWGGAYLDKTLPSDPAQITAQSPARRAEEFEIPLFIVHGKDDFRAAFEHAEVMRDALEKAGKPFEWLVKDREEHGFYEPENTEELFERVLGFFDQHLVAVNSDAT
jgi:dipeptidyl aminopeptidase/acylaminoacyl peptidase